MVFFKCMLCGLIMFFFKAKSLLDILYYIIRKKVISKLEGSVIMEIKYPVRLYLDEFSYQNLTILLVT